MLSTLFFLLANSAFGAIFENAFIKMEIPEGWTCELQEGQYLCQDQKYKKQNYALLVISAKKSSADDSIQAYQAYLSKPITRVTQNFQELKSTVVKTGKSVRNGVEWVESVHKNSEAKGYTTKYFATAQRGLSVLVTLSVHDKYLSIFDRLFAKSWDTLALKDFEPSVEGTVDQNTQLLAEQDLSNLTNLPAPSSTAVFMSKNSLPVLIIAFGLISGFFLFIFLRNRK